MADNPQEQQDRATFQALMHALSFPGRLYALPQVDDKDPFEIIADALLDLETTFYTPVAPLADYLSSTGANATPPAAADYHFYPWLDADALPKIQAASIGTQQYPDQGATLIIGMGGDDETSFTLTGPGIQTTEDLTVRGIPAGFWDVRAKRLKYPLGWDVFFVGGDGVAGLPRTTQVIPKEG